ncbi:MAG: hypothetical protein CMM56_10190 [Rhodospirillaceae bacterium]|nr:hypothetical protein [Rhodospirillaceae bacterium]
MKSLSYKNLLLSLACLLASGLSTAHHSHSMFDHSGEVTITGTVTKFTFRNPHVFLFVDVEQENGGVVNYWIEMSNIPNMIKRGIGYKTFEPGDKVTVNMWKLKDGRPGGNYTTIVAADGQLYD